MKEIQDEMEQMYREMVADQHPAKLAKETFREDVMKLVTSDHHKTKDGYMSFHYDHWQDEWQIRHDGYIREIKGSGKTWGEAVAEYTEDLQRANREVLWGSQEDAINEQLPKDIYVEFDGTSFAIYKCSEGYERLSSVQFSPDLTVEKVVELVKGNLEDK